MTSTVAPYLLPKMLRYLSVNHPDIELHVEEARTAPIISQLERGELDVALLAAPLDNDELLEIPLYRERLMAYVSPGEPIYGDKELRTGIPPRRRGMGAPRGLLSQPGHVSILQPQVGPTGCL